MDVRNKILSSVSFRNFYARYIPTFDFHEGMPAYNVVCPFHSDDTPSMTINIEDGLWFCHSCDIGGSIFDFYMQMFTVDFKISAIEIAKEFNIDIGDYTDKVFKTLNNVLDDVKRCNNDLLNNIDGSLTYLTIERGINKETIKKYLLGYSNKTRRTTFPIFDGDNLLNIRQHSRHKSDRDKGFKVLGVKNYNQIRLYPASSLNRDTINLFAGEMDCMLALSLGVTGAITKTGPEKQWYDSFTTQLAGKNINIIYDNDKAGSDGARLIAKKLLDKTKQVKIITLPLNDKGEDFTDFIIKYDNTIDDFNLCVKDAKVYEAIDDDAKVDTNIHKVTLEESSLDKYYYKTVTFDAICAGKDLNPFLVPRKINARCNMSRDKTCVFCKLQEAKGNLTIEYGINDPDILEFVSASQTQKIGIIKKKLNIPQCTAFKAEVIEAQNIEECFLVPAINFKDISYEDIYRKIYFLGQGMTMNQTYTYNGITVPDPRDQHAVVMINKADNSDTDIDSFKLDKDTHQKLKIFKTEKTCDAIDSFFKRKYKDLSENIFQIYNRLDLMVAIDLVFHSALKFKFQKIEMEKSHVEGLIIGDTRTGKSVACRKLINHYRLGELINCEKATIPGLIGGTHDLGSRKILTWGVIPRNDRRLVVLDEADGLDQEMISNLSGMRSSCIAERTIAGGTRKTLARTRLLWLANPRGFKNISEYPTGIEAIKTLIGKPEDIARFDFAIAISQKDVPIDVINKPLDESVEHIFTSFLCNRLLLWAWSRKEENIEFTPEATSKILKFAVAFGKIFSADIPIVHPNEQRIKLARLAVSVAMATFSTEDGENVLIEEHHVDYVAKYLMDIYSSPVLSYTNYSTIKISESTIADEEEVKARVKIGFSDKLPFGYDYKHFVSYMLTLKKIRAIDIKDALQSDSKDEMEKVKQYLIMQRCIKKEHTYWIVSEPFRFLLRQIQSENK